MVSISHQNAKVLLERGPVGTGGKANKRHAAASGQPLIVDQCRCSQLAKSFQGRILRTSNRIICFFALIKTLYSSREIIVLDFGDESTNPYDFDQTTTPTPPGGNRELT